MIARLQSLMQSSFLRAVAVLSGGQAVAILVPILAAPILGRLYMPADYGALAAYMAPAAILAVLASLQFQHAIIAERTDHNAALVGWICLTSALVIGGLTALVVAFFWTTVFLPTATGEWFVLLPLTVASAGLVVTGRFQANRHRYYRWIAVIQMSHVLATIAMSIMLGLWGWGANGLLTAYFVGQGIQIAGFGILLVRGDTALSYPQAGRIRVLIKRHWKFPAFTLPSEFSGQVNMQMPVLALTAMGADATLGAFTRARQLVSMPVTVLGQSVAQVFRREGSELYRQTGSCRGLMLKTAGGMLAAGILPCAAFMVFAPWLFAVYLGPAWREAGELARILAPMLLMRAAVSPLTTVFFFTGRQALDLTLMLISAAIMCACVSAAWMGGGSGLAVVWGFSLGYGAIYTIYFIATFKVAGP